MNSLVDRRNIIGTSIESVNSLFPTSSWEANNWDSRLLPWEGLKGGRDLSHDLNTDAVWELSGLNYGFEKTILYDAYGNIIPLVGILRDDNKYFLGAGTKRFSPIGNERTKELCDILFSLGFGYENAGVFDGGKITYVSMRWKERISSEEPMRYYVVVVNSFDGSKPFGVYITPVRITCKNTLSLAIKSAKRFWKLRHTKNAHIKLEEVRAALTEFNTYINGFENEISNLKRLYLPDHKLKTLTELLFPSEEGISSRALKGITDKREELIYRYKYAPDLDGTENSAFRFINAVSDYADHSEPLRKTKSWREKRFEKNMGGSEILDVAYKIVSEI